ncbi:MAG: hypothetical protein ACE5G0_20970, partial [Rhodothermales bacterium]
QVHEARERERPFIEYEIRLARYLGLSLLATEIGTVETFNQDWMVSRVGARSRYQMMPYILRRNDIRRYRLSTSYGRKIKVYEEWHPLLTMEPAFLLLRGYINAVGHEVPGLSAYHTGPGNIFKVYELFLKEAPDLLYAGTSVVDAYVWALTEGYDKVSSTTSFKAQSRGYVPAGYGALRAVEKVPIDTLWTLHAERVQLKEGRSIYLSDLLEALEESGVHLRWARGTASLSLYERFRRLNPHFDLPQGDEDGIPATGNVRLVDQVGNATVRFFLPLNATTVLAQNGIDALDDEATFRFDHNTYRLPDNKARTPLDTQYHKLVQDIGRFGFTRENKARLDTLAVRFEQRSAEQPTHHHLSQSVIIKTHQQLWQFKGWTPLANIAETVQDSIQPQPLPSRPLERMPVRPPIPPLGG